MVVEQVEVTVGEFLAVHRFDAVGQQASVDADETRLGQLTNQSGDVLLLHVGVGVVFRARGGVRSVDVVAQEVDFLTDLAVLGVFLAVQDVVFGHRVILFRHQGRFHLVLDFLDGHAVGHADAAQNAVKVLISGVKPRSQEGFADGDFDFFERESFLLAVSFGDVKSSVAHIMCSFSICCVVSNADM